MDINELRYEYVLHQLRRHDLHADPFDQFTIWLKEAIETKVIEPNAMALATATLEGKPSCRMVLLKRFDRNGVVFYTHLKSRKATELISNPHASATVFWKELQRQVHFEGIVEQVDREEAAAYFALRPRRSQISAWASSQDERLSSRQPLEDAYAQIESRYRDQGIPLPPFWGGFRIRPTRFEFWQGRRDRLHDRFCSFGKWILDNQSPRTVEAIVEKIKRQYSDFN